MKIAGFQGNTFVDYPGKIAAIVFTSGCNMNCHWCHNRSLLPGSNKTLYSDEAVFAHLDKRKGLIDALVISGGEPTLQKDLPGFVRRAKDSGVLVKLDSNGTHPEVLKQLIDENLLDYIAMDIKAPLEKYPEICNVKVDEGKIKESIELLRSCGVNYEFRTTYVPLLGKEDIIAISELIDGSRAYYLQQYRETEWYFAPPHPVSELQEIAAQIKHKFEIFGLRGI